MYEPEKRFSKKKDDGGLKFRNIERSDDEFWKYLLICVLLDPPYNWLDRPFKMKDLKTGCRLLNNTPRQIYKLSTCISTYIGESSIYILSVQYMYF